MEKSRRKTPWLERTAAAIGAALAASLLGVLAWEAAQDAQRPPSLSVEIERVVETERGFTAEVRVRNDSHATAAAVVVEGQLGDARSEVTLDYVAGRSTRHAGLFFEQDPRRGDLAVRVLGYVEP